MGWWCLCGGGVREVTFLGGGLGGECSCEGESKGVDACLL